MRNSEKNNSDMSITISKPDGFTGNEAVRLHSDGKIEIYSKKDGQLVVCDIEVLHLTSGVSRPLKNRFSYDAVGTFNCLPQEHFLTFDYVIFVDTSQSDKIIDGRSLTTTAYILFEIKDKQPIVVGTAFIVNVWRDINDPVHCEKYGWFLAIQNTKNRVGYSRCALVTDHELGKHSDINARKSEFIPGSYLPIGYELVYARDRNHNLYNHVIRCLDKASRKYRERYENALHMLDFTKGKFILNHSLPVDFHFNPTESRIFINPDNIEAHAIHNDCS